MKLLEHSLFKDEQDITTQQFLIVEKFISKAENLDKRHQHYSKLIKPLSKQIIVLKEAYLTHEPPRLIAQQVRRLRQLVSGQLYIYK